MRIAVNIENEFNPFSSNYTNDMIKWLEQVGFNNIRCITQEDYWFHICSINDQQIIEIVGLNESKDYSIYNVLGAKINDGIVIPDGRINVSRL